MHPKIMMNEKDNKIFSSHIVVPSENEIWVIKKNSGSGKKAINAPFPQIFPSGYDNIMHNNISAKISKKIIESLRSRRGKLLLPGFVPSRKKNAQRVNQKRYPNYSFYRKHLL